LDLQSVFDNLVDVTEPICQALDSAKADMTIFDSSGIEAWVTENNPKFANRIIKQLKAYAKANHFDSNYDPYKAAYGSMPTHASANPEIKQLYINGHFCYVYKFGIVTNGLGIVRHISFYNKDFLDSHPEIITEKKSDSPDEDKSIHDARLLIPTLQDFFRKHPLINPHIFLGDSAFDSLAVYKQSPCCPNDDSLCLKKEGNNTAFLKNGIARQKFICPKTSWDKCEDGKYRRVCHCDNPCTSSMSGRMVYVYPEKNLRAYPGVLRGTDEWLATYKIRSVVEQDINHIKDNLCLAGRKTQNAKTLHADLLLSGITQLISVLLADKIHQHEYIRSAKPLIA